LDRETYFLVTSVLLLVCYTLILVREHLQLEKNIGGHMATVVGLKWYQAILVGTAKMTIIP